MQISWKKIKKINLRKLLKFFLFPFLFLIIPLAISQLDNSSLINQYQNLQNVDKLDNSSSHNRGEFAKAYHDPSQNLRIPDANTGFSGFGEIKTIKITGLPLWKGFNDIFSLQIRDIGFKGDSGFINKDSYSIDYVRKNAFGLPGNIQDITDTEKQNIKDLNPSTKTEFSNIGSPQNFEINFSFQNAQNIKGIYLGVNYGKDPQAWEIQSWDKIGSVSIVNSENEIYRVNSIPLEEVQNDDTSDKSLLNLKLSLLTSKDWEYYSPTVDRTNDTFMWEYIGEPNTNESVYYNYGNVIEDRSLTPVISPNVNVSIYDNNTQTFIYSEYIDGESSLTNEELLPFLLAIDDTSFIASLSNKYNVSSRDMKSITSKFIESFDNTIKNNNDLLSNKGWNIELNFSRDASARDLCQLNNMAYLSRANKINNITFVSQILDFSFPYTFDLSCLTWLNISELTKVEFLPSLSFNSAHNDKELFVVGDISELHNIVKNHWLSEIKIPTYIPLSNNSFASLGDQVFYSKWVSEMNKGFTFYLPKDSIIDAVINAQTIFDISDITNGQREYKLAIKNTMKSFGEPKLFLNQQGDYEFSKLFINDEEIFPTIRLGDVYWDFSPLFANQISIGDVVYGSLDEEDNYYTQEYADARLDISRLIEISPKKDYDSLPIASVTLKHPGQVTATNLEKYNNHETINIDGIEHKMIMYNSTFLWDFDITSIKYYYQEQVASSVSGTAYEINNHFFTSIDSLIGAIGFNGIKEKEVFSTAIETRSSSIQLYNSWALADKSFFTFKQPDLYNDITTITIDDEIINKILISKGKYYWEITSDIDLTAVKYIDDQGNYFTGIFDIESGIIRSNLTEVESPSSSDNATLVQSLEDLGQINNIEQLLSIAVVDGQNIGVSLRVGSIFWNYDISQIRYLSVTEDGIQYFTNINYIKDNNIPIETVSSVDTTVNINRIIPSKYSWHGPILENSIHEYVYIDSQLFSTFFAAGKWVWDIPKNLVDSIKYKDSRGSYYTNLNDGNYLKTGLGEVSKITTYVEELKNGAVEFPMLLSQSNFKWAQMGTTFRGKTYPNLLLESKIYISPDIEKNARYIIYNEINIDTKGTMEAFSSLEKAKEATEKNSEIWEIRTNHPDFNNDNNANLTDEELDKLFSPVNGLPDPKKETLLSIFNGQEFIDVRTIEVGDKYFYDNLELLQSIKFISVSNNVYYTEIVLSRIKDLYTSVDINKSKLESTSLRSDIVFTETLKVRNEISFIIGVLSLSIGISVLMFSIIVFVLMKKRGLR